MAEPTPGPWSRGGMFGTRVKAGDREICDCLTGGNADEDATSAANARLIAAAPTLYEALYDLMALRAYCDERKDGELFDAAEAALAKARGER